jgi:hypothetical protein
MAPPFSQHPIEADGVDIIVGDVEHIAAQVPAHSGARSRIFGISSEGTSQSRDRPVHDGRSCGRRVITPEKVDQLFDRQWGASMKNERDKQGVVARRTESYHAPVGEPHLRRTQDSELHTPLHPLDQTCIQLP